MPASHRFNRRSFMTSVIGGVFGTGALATVTGQARAQTGPYTGVTDQDSGSYADNAGHGRGPGGNAWGRPDNRSGVTDTDPTDPSGNGRGGQSGYSDSDSGQGADPSGRGRRGRPTQTGITDSDPHDRSGEGRGTSGGEGRRPWRTRPDGTPIEYTGITDSDGGQSRDPSGYGRGSRECRDQDHSNANWQRRDPVRRCE